jgi:ergothioneine biosynthesis protein EgtB
VNAPKELSGAALEAESLSASYASIRACTESLAAPLSDEDACVQSMPDASPAKWHLAHTTWFFETFVLERYESGFAPSHPAFRVLFNSYYNGVGEQHPRAQRGMLTRPSLREVREYRSRVDERMLKVLGEQRGEEGLGGLVTLGLNHEQQHQELLLTDIKHLLSLNPLRPAYHDRPLSSNEGRLQLEWRSVEGGLVSIGHEGAGFAFDNELPRHAVHLPPFKLATRKVTNGEYLQFVEEGGYEQPALWLSEGWNWVRENRLAHPMYWFRQDGGWREFTLSGGQPLERARPVVHVSYFEADAFSRWAGARLPTEAEWESAAASCAREGNFADRGILHPAAAAGTGLRQMFGDAWEWTHSSYAPYPGYRQIEGAIGEYNGKFMVNQYVLRGGSCATPSGHIRAGYRNFFPTSARWQFSGIRLARDD